MVHADVTVREYGAVRDVIERRLRARESTADVDTLVEATGLEVPRVEGRRSVAGALAGRGVDGLEAGVCLPTASRPSPSVDDRHGRSVSGRASGSRGRSARWVGSSREGVSTAVVARDRLAIVLAPV